MEDGRYALPEGNPCAGCDHCCRYVTINIPTPRTKLDFNNIRWYILHRNVSVFVDWEGDWMVQFDTPCEWLVDGRCSHYTFRPEICRDYDPAECERYSPTPAEKFLIRTEQDLDEYLAKRSARSAARRARAKKKSKPESKRAGNGSKG
jgi:Fe-S-cluster containining protein